MGESPQLDLILIGKAGNGKSATGNSILRKDAFGVCYQTISSTNCLKSEITHFENRPVKVVDCPGIMSPAMDITQGHKVFESEINKAISENPNADRAFLVVIKYGNRFTQDEQIAITILKSILGKDVIKSHGVLVMTNGDTFEALRDKHNLSLDDYCIRQEGPFQELYNECNKRIVMFNNITKDETVKNKQLAMLFEKVKELLPNQNRLANKECVKAESLDNDVINKNKMPFFEGNTIVDQSLTVRKNQEMKLLDKSDENVKDIPTNQNKSMKLFNKTKLKERNDLITDFFERSSTNIESTCKATPLRNTTTSNIQNQENSVLKKNKVQIGDANMNIIDEYPKKATPHTMEIFVVGSSGSIKKEDSIDTCSKNDTSENLKQTEKQKETKFSRFKKLFTFYKHFRR